MPRIQRQLAARLGEQDGLSPGQRTVRRHPIQHQLDQHRRIAGDGCGQNRVGDEPGDAVRRECVSQQHAVEAGWQWQGGINQCAPHQPRRNV